MIYYRRRINNPKKHSTTPTAAPLTSSTSTPAVQPQPTHVTFEQKKPAWTDDDDAVQEMVNEPNFNELCPKGKKRKITTNEYEIKLKSEYERIMGRPLWAEKLLNKKSDIDNHSDDSDDELFRRTGNYLRESTVLKSGIIDCKQCAGFKHDIEHAKLLRSVEFHPSARVLLTAGRSQYLNLFQVDGKLNNRIQSVFFDNYSLDTAHFTRDGNQVILSGKRNFFKVYDMIEGKIMQIPMMKGYDDRLSKFEMSPDGSLIVFISDNGRIHFVSAKSKELIESTQLSGNITSVTFRPDGDYMFASGDEGLVTVFDVRRRAAVHRFVDEGSSETTSQCVSPNQQYFITGQKSGIVNIYSYNDVLQSREPKPLKYLKNLTTPIQTLKMNCTSELLVMNSYFLPRAVRLVHFPSFTVYENFPEFTDKKVQIVNSVDFSLNSGYLTLGNNNGKVLLYRLKYYGNY